MEHIFLSHYQMSVFGGALAVPTCNSKTKKTRMKRIATATFMAQTAAPAADVTKQQQPTTRVKVKHLLSEPTLPPCSSDSLKDNKDKDNKGCTGHSTSGSDAAAKDRQPQHQPLQEREAQEEEHHPHHDSCSCEHKTTDSITAVSPSPSTDAPPTYADLPPALAQDIVSRTEARFANTLAKSKFLQEHVTTLSSVPRFTLDENLTKGNLIASGGFASVCEAIIKQDENSTIHTSPNHQYVVKLIAPKLYKPPRANDGDQQEQPQPQQKVNWYAKHRKIYLATKDLLMEAHLLAGLDHPNILSLHGISAGGVSQLAETNRTDAFYMVLPRLACTLEDKIEAWKLDRIQWEEMHAHQHRPLLQSLMHPHKRRQEMEERQQRLEEVFRERLQVIIDLLKALEYLHERLIMHRDVKPGNIGFDEDGCLKLFDFGLAKDLPPEETHYTGNCPHQNTNHASNVFTLPGNTGTSRYMPPEIINRLPYNCKCDVYSATITLWQCLALKKPFGDDVTGQFVKECVAIYGDRPHIPRKWPKGIRKVLQLGWVRDIATRPSSTELRVLLEEVIEHPNKLHS